MASQFVYIFIPQDKRDLHAESLEIEWSDVVNQAIR